MNDFENDEIKLKAMPDATPEQNRVAVRAILGAARDVTDAALLLDVMGLGKTAEELQRDRR